MALVACLPMLACRPVPVEAQAPAPATQGAIPTARSAPALASAGTAPIVTAPVVRALGWVGDEGFYSVHAPNKPNRVVGVRLDERGENLETVLDVVGGSTLEALARFDSRLIVSDEAGEGLLFYATPSAKARSLPGKRAVFTADGSHFAVFGGEALLVCDGLTGIERRRYTLRAVPQSGFFVGRNLVGYGDGLAIVDVDRDGVVYDDVGLASVESPSRRYAALLKKHERDRWREGVVHVWDLRTSKRLPPMDVGEINRGGDFFDLMLDEAERHLYVVRRGSSWRDSPVVLAEADLATGAVRRFAGPPQPGTPATDSVDLAARLAKRFAAIVKSPRKIVESKRGPGHNGAAFAIARNTVVLFTGEYEPTPYTPVITNLEIAVIDAASGSLRNTLSPPVSGTSTYHTVDAQLGPNGRFLLLTLGGEAGTEDHVVDVESGAMLSLGKVDPGRSTRPPRWRFTDSGGLLFGDAGVVVLERLHKVGLPRISH
jgi:hypothetical protein